MEVQILQSRGCAQRTLVQGSGDKKQRPFCNRAAALRLVSSKKVGRGLLQRDQENPIFEDLRKDPKASRQRALEKSNLQSRTGFLRPEFMACPR